MSTAAPLAIDLYSGLHGWADGFLAEGYRVKAFDIVDMCKELGHERKDGIELFIRDVRSLHGSQFTDAAVIVASPPCTEYSYMAMPWSRAKQIARALRGKDEFPEGYTGSRTIAKLNELFEACFRIQWEACAAACRQIPLIVENVKGAQPWVGRSVWNYGSFHLWGNLPALMPIVLRHVKAGGSWTRERPSHTSDHSWKPEGVKVSGLNWSGSDKPGYIAKAFNDTAVAQLSGQKLPGNNSERRWEDRPVKRLCEAGIKVGGGWFGSGNDCSLMRQHTSKSIKRKAASAQIAKIPFPLAQHIARVFKPAEVTL